jgi:hypothetical protein
MNDESARMIDLARRDRRAAQGMAVDTLSFTDEIFGFGLPEAADDRAVRRAARTR